VAGPELRGEAAAPGAIAVCRLPRRPPPPQIVAAHPGIESSITSAQKLHFTLALMALPTEADVSDAAAAFMEAAPVAIAATLGSSAAAASRASRSASRVR